MRLDRLIVVCTIWGVFSSIARADILIKLNCDTPPYKPCAQMIEHLVNGHTGSNEQGDLTITGLIPTGKQLFEGLEEGKLADEKIAAPPFCNPLGTRMNACVDENEKNSKGESCGKLVVLHRSMDRKIHSALRTSPGSLESAMAAGAIKANLAHQVSVLEDQIRANALKVPSGSACAPIAADLKALIDRQKGMVNLDKLAACDPKRLNECAARQYFDASLQSIHASYFLTLRCLMVDQAARAHRAFSASIYTEIEDGIMKDCGRSCRNNECLNSCYKSKFASWLKSLLSSKYPGASRGC